jgi:hypothetical protein
MYYAVTIFTALLGEDAITDNDIICAQDKYLIVHTNAGALYMTFYTCTIILYSMVMLYIFYKLPVQYNMVAYNKLG